MTDQPQTPSTEARLAVEDAVDLASHWNQRAVDAERKLATEGHIAALRAALEAALYALDLVPTTDHPSTEARLMARVALLDTASAATEERERIEKPWREALAKHQRVVTAHIRDHPMRAPDCATCDELARIGIETLEAIDKARHSLLNSDTEGQLEEGGR